MKNGIQLSIIIPVFNVEKYLEECINSVLQQTFSNFEIILVDDGSTDSSGNICDLYSRKDRRIQVIHKENGGLSSARNAGLRIAKGKYVGFIDSDDWISETMYQHLYEEAEKTAADIASCRYQEVDRRPKLDKNIYHKTEIREKQEVLKAFFLRKISESVCDKIFRKELWEEIRFPEGEINEDTITLFYILLKSHKLIYFDSPEYYYRKRQGSITKSGYSKRFLAVDKHLEKMEKTISEELPEMKKYLNYFLSVHYYCLLISILRSGENKIFKNDYRYFRKKFVKVFKMFVKWGTGKKKDIILAICLCCPGSYFMRYIVRK